MKSHLHRDFQRQSDIILEAMKNILVVDDDPAARNIISSMLKTSAHNSIEAINSTDALRVLRKFQPFDAVITDIEMPGMDGFELAKIIRMIHPALPILFVSGNGKLGMNIPLELQSEKGFHFLEKPFSYSSFTDNVRAILNLNEP